MQCGHARKHVSPVLSVVLAGHPSMLLDGMEAKLKTETKLKSTPQIIFAQRWISF